MTTYTIPQKMSNSGSIHDIASDMFDRNIVFAPGCKYAVVLASYYGGKGYTTHKTAEATIAESRRQRDYSHQIIDAEGNEYVANHDRLERRYGCEMTDILKINLTNKGQQTLLRIKQRYAELTDTGWTKRNAYDRVVFENGKVPAAMIDYAIRDTIQGDHAIMVLAGYAKRAT